LLVESHASRRQFERDLDDAQQQLSILSLKLKALENDLSEGRATADSARDAGADLDWAMQWLRDLAHRLYPMVLTHDGLGAALREAIARESLDVSLDVGKLGRYSTELESVIYFCILDAVESVRGVDGASISLEETEGGLRFEAAGNHPGEFGVTASSRLRGVADAVGAMGGELSIESRTGGGRTVTGLIPL
jgi:signal transduction histidine kinase